MTPLRIGRPRTTLVVAPHADDEAIGAYGLIRRLRLRGCAVRVVVVTDGAASHPGSARWPRARLVARRRRETRAAMARIGVAAGAVGFLDLPDGALSDASAQRLRAVGRAVRRVRNLDLLVTPRRDDAHPDHRAVARAVAAVRTPGARRLAYLVWPDAATRAHGPALHLPLGPARAAKRAAIGRYATQTGAIRDDPGGFAIAAHELAAFCRPVERYLRVRR